MAAKNELHLVLMGKWFDMIQADQKRREYRDMNEYWWKRINAFLRRNGIVNESEGDGFPYLSIENSIQFWEHPVYVVFHRGYTNITHRARIAAIYNNPGYDPDRGAEYGKWYITIEIALDVVVEMNYLRARIPYLDVEDERRAKLQRRYEYLDRGGDPELHQLDYSNLFK